MPRVLTPEEVASFRERGLVKSIRIFDPHEVREILHGFARVFELLDPDESPYSVDSWEKYNTWLFELVHHPRLLDCVEDLLGPNIYQWSSQVLCKMPNERIYIPWHQDLGDWPLSPHEHVTLWLALDDVDADNGAIRYIPGSHRWGPLPHRLEWPPQRPDGTSLIPLSLDVDEDGEFDVVELQAGEISMHDVRLVHGSPGNCSSRRRFGFQICYAPTHVRFDDTVKNENGNWEGFDYFLARGVDRFRHHPQAPRPAGFGRGPRKEYRLLSRLDR